MTNYILVAFVVLGVVMNGANAISCFSRSLFTSSASNGSMVTCSSLDSMCYQYESSNGNNYAGCGSCSWYSMSGYETCRTCSTNYCNTRPITVNCYYSFGDLYYSSRRRMSCTTSNCYEYSYSFGIINYFFAGCGDCSAHRAYSNCRSCNTDYCNSTGGLRACWTGMATAVAMLALMKWSF